MRTTNLIAAAVLASTLAAPGFAQGQGSASPSMASTTQTGPQTPATPPLPDSATSVAANGTVTERDSNGRATKVVVDGRIYDVCAGTRTDGCVNPREAGLRFGNRPLGYWPGAPASEQPTG